MFASVNEACKILDEGEAYRASDIDVMWLNGFGFPRYRGELMDWPGQDEFGDAIFFLSSPGGSPRTDLCLRGQ